MCQNRSFIFLMEVPPETSFLDAYNGAVRWTRMSSHGTRFHCTTDQRYSPGSERMEHIHAGRRTNESDDKTGE